jgi:catechol 2,3-dioxygenase-like lactoylglutathione lyase family enzyme
MEFRYARHTNSLKPIIDFYTNILGFKILFSFENHNGYNGAMLGKSGLNWHLEFTESGTTADHTFDEEDILVFYPEKDDYQEIIKNIRTNHIPIIKAKNPFWEDNGVMIKDPDGHRIIISNMRIK